MSIIRGSWDARTEDFIGEKLGSSDGSTSHRDGREAWGRRTSCRAKQAAREDKLPGAHVCELCEHRCGSHRYLCVGCAGQLGLIGSYRERQESLLRKREESEERSDVRDRGVA